MKALSGFSVKVLTDVKMKYSDPGILEDETDKNMKNLEIKELQIHGKNHDPDSISNAQLLAS